MDVSLDDLIKSRKGAHAKPRKEDAPKKFVLGTTEQLSMSLDDVIASQSRKSARATKKTADVQAMKRQAALARAKNKRQESLNQKRGIPAAKPTPNSAQKKPMALRLGKAKRGPMATSRVNVAQLNTNALRRVNLRKRQLAKANGNGGDEEASAPQRATARLQNWEKHSRDHPVKWTLPEGTNFRISIDLDRVNSVVGIGAPPPLPQQSARK